MFIQAIQSNKYSVRQDGLLALAHKVTWLKPRLLIFTKPFSNCRAS